MNNNEFFEAILRRVEKNDHTKFQFLSSYLEYASAIKFHNANQILIRRLRKAVNQVFKNYLVHVREGSAMPEELIAFHKLRNCVNFFEEEKRIMTDMIEEYYAYTFSGHFFKQFFFSGERAEEDKHDFRKGTINLY